MEHRPDGLCSVGTGPEACRYLSRASARTRPSLLAEFIFLLNREIALRRSGASHGVRSHW